jgi:hypothetical protein
VREGGAGCAFSIFDAGAGGGLGRLDLGHAARWSWRQGEGVAGEAGEALLFGVVRRQRDLDAGDQLGDAGGDLEKARRIVSNWAQHQNEVLGARPFRVCRSQ